LSEKETFGYLAEPVRQFLLDSGISQPTPPQTQAFPIIAAGENVLLVAPTGSGKTEAAMLPLLSRLVSPGYRGEGISLLYITPLRALNRDMLRRLKLWCTKLDLTIDVRHGDTPMSQRSRQSRHPPDLLVTTPESLQAVLPGRRMRENLRHLKAVVVDEVHNLVESKRGVQLCVGLERLRGVAGGFQLVGLSATVGSPELTAKFLFGEGGTPFRIVKAEAPKKFEYSIEYPVPDQSGQQMVKEAHAAPDLSARLARMNQLIETHRSTLIFVNSRTLAEMLGEKLGRIRTDVGVHHGSLPREERERVEQAFKSGQLKALVCTSTLELGIDVGSVDLVVQYMSPRQVTSLVQRVGRSGHRLSEVSKGVLITVSTDDILESSCSIAGANAGELEPTRPYHNSLDVLAHQVCGYLMDKETMEGEEMFKDIRRASPFSDLPNESFWRVVNYLSELRKLRVEGTVLNRTRATREYYYENLSMIPDETRYLVIDVTANQTVGILGQEYVLLHAKVGVHFICKGKIWQIEKVSDDRKIYVTPVEDPLAAVPGWDGEMLPIPYGLAVRTGKLRREISEALDVSEERLSEVLRQIPSESAAKALVTDEIQEQKEMGAPVPSDRVILFEGFGKFLIVHLCFGESVNRTFAYVFEEILSRRGLVQLWWMDGYRLLMELTEDTEDLDLASLSKELMGITPDELERTYGLAVQRNFPFPARVKVVAERFGAIKRGRFIAHPNLCSLPTRFERTPIYEEALQETGRDLIDMSTAKQVLSLVASKEIEVQTFQAHDRPTPIAYHLLYRYLEVPEAVALDSLGRSSYLRMKTSIFGTQVGLVCMKCGTDRGSTAVGDLVEEPRCSSCGSGLLTPCFWGTFQVVELLGKRQRGEALNDEEKAKLAKARRGADLVLSYGKKAVVAQSVYGIGPQTASRILAEMHEDEEEFYRGLLEAKIKFITTRQFWSD
jgi:ATP-dependent Lhr-like helicase